MFARIFSTLSTYFQPDALRVPRPVGARLTRAQAEADEAMRMEWSHPVLSERRSDPHSYRELRYRRREALLRLLIVNPSDEIIARIADLVAMIIEEPTWSENADGTCFDDDNHPQIDLMCSETAVLFAWTIRALRPRLDRMDTSIVQRMRTEVRRRLLRPITLNDDYAFMSGECSCPIAICCDILLCALLLESDETRLGRAVKPALKLLDDACAMHGRSLSPLRETVTDISALSDFAGLLSILTNQRVDFTDQLPSGDALDEILYSWIQGDWFNDPAGEGMHPILSGSDIYRIGENAGDQSLIELGAHLYHQNHLAPQTVTGRMMEIDCADRLENTFGKPQRLRYAAMRGNLLMAARVPGLYCSMHVGGGRGNAGDVCLFAADTPILVDGGPSCPARSVPVLGGQDQLMHPLKPCIADFEAREDRQILSVDLTQAYPAECALRSYQRTVMTLRAEHTVRIVDALDFASPQSVTLRFVSAVKPTLLSTAIRFGSVRMTW